MASRPLPAVDTTSILSCKLSSDTMPSLINRWSSTTSTRTRRPLPCSLPMACSGIVVLVLRGRLGGGLVWYSIFRHSDSQAGAFAGRALHLQRAAQQLQALTQPLQTVAAAFHGVARKLPRYRGLEPGAVVAHPQCGIDVPKLHFDHRRA